MLIILICIYLIILLNKAFLFKFLSRLSVAKCFISI